MSVKYVALVLRADNQGEGGILALTALDSRTAARRRAKRAPRLAVGRPLLIALGIFGTALLYGDGMITPAISVLGAVEGLEVVTPLFSPYVVPITVVILIGAVRDSAIRHASRRRAVRPDRHRLVRRHRGARRQLDRARAGSAGGAFDPRYAVRFFNANGFMGFAVLGAVVLAVTGGEALYADMGHFGRKPIRLAWFGAGAAVAGAELPRAGRAAARRTRTPRTRSSSWRRRGRCCRWSAIATAAAIIASQALISGSFSITRQAVQLGLAPRLDVEHTSAKEMGQVYVPRVNWALMVATVLIVIGFRSSGAIAAAYGIAVTLTMIITVLLLYVVMTERWQLAGAGRGAGDGRLPHHRPRVLRRQRAEDPAGRLAAAGGRRSCIFTLMTTWRTGRQIVAERLASRAGHDRGLFHAASTT